MKKILTFILVLTLLTGMAACSFAPGSTAPASTVPASPDPQPTDPMPTTPTASSQPITTPTQPAGPSGADGTYQLGDIMEDFTVTMSDGAKMTLSAILETKELVIINFWASWCGPCQREFPYMDAAYQKYRDKVEIIALSVEPSDSNSYINSFKNSLGLSALPLGRDTIGLSSKFDFTGIPTSVAIDRYGVVCWQETGAITSVQEFIELFDAFLEEDHTGPK